jgi:chromosome segregation ATPase
VSIATVRETASEPAKPPLVPIMELPFTRTRLPLLQAGGNAVDAAHSRDRTCLLVGKWQALSDTLPKIRASTMTTQEAVEVKGAVVLRIADREKYVSLQATIKDHQEQIASIEQAIRELDALNCGWLSEIRSQRDARSSVESQQRKMLSTWATAALNKGYNSKLSVEEILSKDQQYLDRKAKVESQIARAKTTLDALIPQIEKIEAVLSGVGC